jgi:hypothetical protein
MRTLTVIPSPKPVVDIRLLRDLLLDRCWQIRDTADTEAISEAIKALDAVLEKQEPRPQPRIIEQ